MLVNHFRTLGLTTDIFSDFSIFLRRQPETEKAFSNLTSSAKYDRFEIEWEVSAWHAETGEIRTWRMRLYWDNDAWIIDLRITESSDMGEVYLYEFDDLRVSDADLEASLLTAGKKLTSLNP